jgi:hypothetical protein
MAEYVSLVFVGFVLGYGARELISRNRRAAVKRLRQRQRAAETAGMVTIFPSARRSPMCGGTDDSAPAAASKKIKEA